MNNTNKEKKTNTPDINENEPSSISTSPPPPQTTKTATTANVNYNSALKHTTNRQPTRSFINTTKLKSETNQNSETTKKMELKADKKKIGHREVKDGVVHYKKVPTDELKKSIQFGIVHSISASNRYPDRDLLMQDFQTVETIVFPKGGTLNGITSTPPHGYNDFKLKVYAPYGFKYLRRKFNVDEADYMKSISETELKEISNPGASGSVFYRTSDDKYILKTVQYQECAFLKKLLAGIYLNLLQNLINNKYSLLPTIYGLYCYQKLEITSMLKNEKTNIRVVVMNNILPSNIKMHEKYDLKGSLYKRKASRQERSKSMPTYKDLDFLEEHPDGIILDDKYYDNIVGSLKRDCLILKSFGIMDYSLLLGIHKLDSNEQQQQQIDANLATAANLSPNEQKTSKINKFFSLTSVPAKNAKGEGLLLYMGIIDILQSYRFRKRVEHTLKSMIADGNQISVCHPEYYENRFVDFIMNKVFKRASMSSYENLLTLVYILRSKITVSNRK